MSNFGVGRNQGNANFSKALSELEKASTSTDTNTRVSSRNSGVGNGVIQPVTKYNIEGITGRRIPFSMTTVEWLERGEEPILFSVNPSEISWNMPQRSTIQKNLYGTVMHAWPDNLRHTFYDELNVSFTFQSGNIMIQPQNADGSGNKQISQGIVSFYDFLKLVDSPKLTTKGRVNHILIQYNSTVLPNITLKGFFDPKGVNWSESANNPNQINSWTADFIVQDTYPRLSDNHKSRNNSALLNNYLSNMVNNHRGFDSALNTRFTNRNNN